MRPWREVELVADLIGRGLPDLEITQLTGVPRRTVSDWRRDPRRNVEEDAAAIDFETLPQDEYAYLLGLF